MTRALDVGGGRGCIDLTNERIVVLHLVRRLKIGGTSTLLLGRITALAGSGIRSIVCSVAPPATDQRTAAMLSTITAGGAEIVTLGHSAPSVILRTLWRAVLLVRTRRVTVIHSTLPLADRVAVVVGLVTGSARVRDIVTTIQPGDPGTLPDRWRGAMRSHLVDRRFARTVFVSEAARRASRGALHQDPMSRVIWPPLIRDDDTAIRHASRAEIRARMGLPANSRLVIAVGRLEPGKGQRHLLAAFHSVIERHPDARLLIVGDGHDRAHLEQASGSLGLDEHVKFMGARSDVPHLLRAADVYVSASFAEGFVGYATLEALSMGVPVVAPRIPSVEELLQHMEHVWLVEPSAPADISEGICGLLDDRPFAEGMGERGRSRVLEKLSLDTFRTQMIHLYREVSR